MICAVGIGMAFLSPPDAGMHGLGTSSLKGDGLALMAGFAWGLTTVLIRTTNLGAIPAAHILFFQMLVAFVVITALAVATGQASLSPSPLLFWNLAFQAVVVAFLSFLTWFWLLTRYRASQLCVFSFMTPLFGVVIGVTFLDEPLTPAFAIGSVGVLVGILV